MVSKRNGIIWVPYGHMVSKVLEHVGFNVENERVPSQKPHGATWAIKRHQAQKLTPYREGPSNQ